MMLPEDDKHSESRRYLLSAITTAYGGRIAEEMVGGADQVSTGASGDIQAASRYVRNMVMKWGLSDKLGPLLYGYDEGEYPGMGAKNFSPDTAKLIDDEIRRISDECYGDAEKLLTDNRDILESMKDALMEYETIDADQVHDLMARRKVRPPKDWGEGDFGGSSGNSDAKDASTDEAPKESPVGGPAAE